jgi:hypothetical protein
MSNSGVFFSFTAQSVSGQKLSEREGAMATRGNQVVLPVGREQDRVKACIVGARGDRQGLIGIVTIHSEPRAIEVPNRRLEDKKVHPSRWLAAIPVSGRVGGVGERIVQRVEIAACGDSDPCWIGLTVIGGGRCGLAHNRLHTPTIAVGVVFLDILSYVGNAQLRWWIHRERS